MWGQLDTLKTLVELSADLQATNFQGEKAVDVARRYDKLDCVEFLALAGEKLKHFSLSTAVKILSITHVIFLNRG